MDWQEGGGGGVDGRRGERREEDVEEMEVEEVAEGEEDEGRRDDGGGAFVAGLAHEVMRGPQIAPERVTGGGGERVRVVRRPRETR